MRVIEGVVPPGGWHFQQKLISSPQRPKTQRVEAATYSQLLDFVLRFRLNNLELVQTGTATKEQVEHDVTFYLCGKWPHQCTGSRAQMALMAGGTWPGPIQKVDYRRPLTRIENWITTLGQEELRWVDQARAHERAQICAGCSMNQSWRSGCAPCNDNAIRRATLVRGAHSTALDKKLRYCVSYGTLLELSIWLEADYSKALPRREPPSKCWKLTEALVS
jgi:hypothetical protein